MQIRTIQKGSCVTAQGPATVHTIRNFQTGEQEPLGTATVNIGTDSNPTLLKGRLVESEIES